MKCKKCGTEMGQKNLCPVCDSDTGAKPKHQADETPNSSENSMADFSKEELQTIDEFVHAHPKDWNDEFDDFFDKNVFAAGYKETFLKCRHRAEIFDAVREMLKDQKKLSGELMIRIMEEIPQKYPEIQEYEARALAKQFFSHNRILKLTLREALDSDILENGFEEYLRGKTNGIKLSWDRNINDMINAGAILCNISPDELAGMHNSEAFEEACRGAFNFMGTTLHSTFESASARKRREWEMMIDELKNNAGASWLLDLVRHHVDRVALTSPWCGKIVFIRPQVHHLDDVICEIETGD